MTRAELVAVVAQAAALLRAGDTAEARAMLAAALEELEAEDAATWDAAPDPYADWVPF